MQFKPLLAFATLVALASAAPGGIQNLKRDDVDATPSFSLTTISTTDTFTATRVMRSMFTKSPFITTITTMTTWTVTHNVTMTVPTDTPTASPTGTA